jgi:hypothetical protein
MPISDKQLAANKANAQKSTGPVTPAGKRASSLNSLRHGVLARSVVLGGESTEQFAAALNAITAEFDPQTPTERTQVEKMAIYQWRLARLWAVESAAIEHEIALQSGSLLDKDAPTRAFFAMRALHEHSGQSDPMSRQEHRLDHHYRQALATLTSLIQTRKSRETPNIPSEPI